MEQNTDGTKPTIHVLWTGGLDSTAKVVELSRKRVIIQPYYIIDSGRLSSRYEIDAMNQIRNRLLDDDRTIATINPVRNIALSEIISDQEITNAWTNLNRKYKVGSQYDFLARYAKQNNIILEVGIEKGDGRAQTSIKTEAKMEPFETETGINYHVSKNDSSNDTYTLYKYFTFPLWEKDKHSEVDLMTQLGAKDIIKMTWFCHTPLFGKPCGHCNPCKDARHYGFGWRLPKLNYYLWYIVRPKLAIRSWLNLSKKHC